MSMPVLDWVFLGLLLLSMLLGAWRGLVFELMSVVGWVAAFVLAQWLGASVGMRLPLSGASEALRYPAGFVVVFVGTVFVAGLLAWVTKKLIEAVGLRPADRALGALFGVVRALVMLLAAATLVHMTPLKDEMLWRQSTGAGVLTVALKGLKPIVPQEYGQYLPD
jgi:membrane protein required for colicin V production